jgi:L-ribulokinase
MGRSAIVWHEFECSRCLLRSCPIDHRCMKSVTASEVYEAADRLMEAADWVIMRMTGVETRNACTAGYKGVWSKREGFPPNAFYKALDPRLEKMVDDKLSRTISPLGSKAGGLTAQAAQWTGLKEGMAVVISPLMAALSLLVSTSVVV